MIPIQIKCMIDLSTLLELSHEALLQVFSTYLLEEYAHQQGIDDSTYYYVDDLKIKVISTNVSQQKLTFQVSGIPVSL